MKFMKEFQNSVINIVTTTLLRCTIFQILPMIMYYCEELRIFVKMFNFL